jgi:hypothetical protein
MAIGQISSVFPPGRNSLEDEKLALYSWSSSWFWGGLRYEYIHNRYRPSLRKQYLRGRSKYAAIARKHVDELFARQSSTLKQAKGRYKLKNDRDPPPGYHLFYEFAQQNGCLIDEYDKARIFVSGICVSLTVSMFS